MTNSKIVLHSCTITSPSVQWCIVSLQLAFLDDVRQEGMDNRIPVLGYPVKNSLFCR